jgi:hypothetical protein
MAIRPKGFLAARLIFFALSIAFGMAVAAALSAPALAAGPIGWGVGGGKYGSDIDDYFATGGLYFSLGMITINPNAEWIFFDNGTSYTLNVDGKLTVLPLGAASGWLGAGLGRLTVDPDNASSTNDTVVNLLAGVGLNAVPFKPYLQGKYMLKDGDDPFGLSIGVRF